MLLMFALCSGQFMPESPEASARALKRTHDALAGHASNHSPRPNLIGTKTPFVDSDSTYKLLPGVVPLQLTTGRPAICRELVTARLKQVAESLHGRKQFGRPPPLA